MARESAFGIPATKQSIDRVVGKYVEQGRKDKYFESEKSTQIFESELKLLLSQQVFSFDSPVWRNVGTDAPQRISSHFILGVSDSIKSIFNWYSESGEIFKRGSNSGTNLSRIRGSCETVSVSSNKHASGPVSFMRGADSSVGAIAGDVVCGAMRTVVLDVDHPDIETFVDCKMLERRKIQALHNAGFDVNADGKDIFSVQYQNANNVVRVSDEFMKAVEAGAPFALRGRCDGDIVETIDARELFHKIAQATWDCADPSIQYDGTINAWHTIPNDGKITASSPNSGYMSVDNTACVSATIDLLKFLTDKNKFDIERFIAAIETIITAMDLSVTFGDFITEKITTNTRKYRSLGLGYLNLDMLLEKINSPYDSEASRNIAAAITSLMTATAYRRSAELAALAGPYNGYSRNVMLHTAIVRKHATMSLEKTDEIVDQNWPLNLEDIIFAANREWANSVELGVKSGWRNSHISLLTLSDQSLTEPMAQIHMMAAAQPFLSGAISKTIFVSESATVEDIEKIYIEGWKMGLKSVIIRRDNCDKMPDIKKESLGLFESATVTVGRRELPNARNARIYSYNIYGVEGCIIASAYPDGKLGEVFIKSGEQDSMMESIMDTLTISLQYGVPLEEFVKRFIDTRPDPTGVTNDSDIPFAHSLLDYVFRRLALDYVSIDQRALYGIYTAEELARIAESDDDIVSAEPVER